MTAAFASLRNGTSLPLASIPEVPVAAFRDSLITAVREGLRLESLFADASGDRVSLFGVLADAKAGDFRLISTTLDGDAYPALTPECPAAHLFERELAEQYGLRPEGHPWLKPVRFHGSRRAGHDAWGRKTDERPTPGLLPFFRVEGEEVHEVAVGPVHAGVIEPGHFRFQCHGEQVFFLEIALGYQYRGIEQGLVGGPYPITPLQMETAAGDTTIGHAWAYAAVMEALAGVSPGERALAIRAVALELERLANHTGDLGAISGDVAFLPTAAYCGRIRGDFLNLTATICGSRLGRSLVRPGGVRFDVDPARCDDMVKRLRQARADVTAAVELMFDTPSAVARFEGTGIVRKEDVLAIGMVGLAARASGSSGDARTDHPLLPAAWPRIPVASRTEGDVNARARIRWDEIACSLDFVERTLPALPAAVGRRQPGALTPNSLALAVVEGWRGGVCHVALTDQAGRFRRYKITDPSFHNWFGLALALRDGQISDFPLCNKSFNLSYCGHDL